MRFTAECVATALAVLVVLGSGCSTRPNQPTARLAGTVSLNGQAVSEGNIQFHPVEAERGIVQVEIRDGRYAAAIPQGPVVVLLNATRTTGRKVQQYSEEVPEVVSVIPPKYRPGIPLEVTGDDPALNFELTSP